MVVGWAVIFSPSTQEADARMVVGAQTSWEGPVHLLCEQTDRMTILHSFLWRRKSINLPLSGKRLTMG